MNIFRIGDEVIDDQEKIERFAQIASRAMPALTPKPYGHSVGFVDDHLHLDLGYTVLVPAEAASDTSPEPKEISQDDG